MKKMIFILALILVAGLVGVAVWIDHRVSLKPSGLPVDNLPQVSYPQPNQVITSPLLVRGKAPGNWFFEATLPVRLLDGRGEILASSPAQAEGDWMTTAPVSFQATLVFDPASTATGTLIIAKDNPSGLAENNAEIRVPVRFVR